MAKTNTKEVAVIDFEKFSVAQLPELQGKKEEIKGIIEANPVVDIIDNSTYELAKKSRTAVKTLRTSLEKEQKDVKKKIKEHVLDVVDAEYDIIVLGVRNQEIIRQEPITAWENKKEEERIEKARWEEERINRIKSTISLFKQGWETKISELKFEGIDSFIEELDVIDLEFNRASLQEFEVLFDDAISLLKNTLDMKIHTLHEQEQIRIDNLLIQEKNAENSRIQEWQRTWNANIDTLNFDDVKDVKSVLVKSKLANLKHYYTDYEEIYTSTEKRLNSQIELISKAETQRIAQEKFQKEKAEFEAKQLEAKYQERKKFLVDEDYWRIYLLAECAEEEDVAKSKLLAFSDSEFEDFKLAIFKAKEPKKDVKTDEIAQEQIREFDEEDVHEVATAKPIEKESLFDISKIENQIWNNIYNLFQDQTQLKKDLSIKDAFDWLSKNYHAPSKKQ